MSQSLEEEWRGTESMLLEVQCEVSTVCDNLGCHASFCWQAYGDADFIFQQDLAPAHTAKGTKTGSMVNVLDWPANTPDLNPIENLWGIVKRMMSHQTQQCRWPKAAIKATWASITPEQCYTPLMQ